MAPMVLYLCRHGEALAGDVEPKRPLSERGIAEVCNMANMLRDNVSTPVLLHSGKTRARQTAELLHERLAPDADIDAGSGLAPEDPVEPFAAQIAEREANLMVVGHLPFINRLASHLLGVERPFLVFQTGSVAALCRDTAGEWTLAWLLSPELAAG
ncbi:MAG TPA: phosphohistidine phosphatase SixA [Arenicellales bacterium]|nr:phosphohistidine phosphatase SixA [Arenicellales bacterium]